MTPHDFEILGELHQIEIIAAGRAVRIRQLLSKKYGSGRWRKMKGIATVRESDGRTYEAEIHWYEAHGIEKVDWKIKRST